MPASLRASHSNNCAAMLCHTCFAMQFAADGTNTGLIDNVIGHFLAPRVKKEYLAGGAHQGLGWNPASHVYTLIPQ